MVGFNLASSTAPPWGTPPKTSKCENYNGVLKDKGFDWKKVAGSDDLSPNKKKILESLGKAASKAFPKALSKTEPGEKGAKLGALLGAVMFGCKIG
ncbi:hypothetical protein [Streptomyces noursei]|uniref:hypothetical protein n=1 Tax=Streptomyces noursei TaxID=1971 RepID=UPI0016752474|nr:hypothetical protein [Streptomyces noursei]MCZ1020318.1 hypothetical protein [Streptomyces noursei]GGX41962.1 hypothetical protein GCM10010341_74950 [Streptomyces noursei]